MDAVRWLKTKKKGGKNGKEKSNPFNRCTVFLFCCSTFNGGEYSISITGKGQGPSGGRHNAGSVLENGQRK
jgi:hypothetical protein